MSKINSKDKGKRGELEVSHILQAHGYTDARRGQQFCGIAGDADVVGVPGLHIEVKRTERLHLYDAMTQAERDAREGEIPVVVHRQSKRPWVVVVTLKDFLEIYRRGEEHEEKILGER